MSSYSFVTCVVQKNNTTLHGGDGVMTGKAYFRSGESGRGEERGACHTTHSTSSKSSTKIYEKADITSMLDYTENVRSLQRNSLADPRHNSRVVRSLYQRLKQRIQIENEAALASADVLCINTTNNAANLTNGSVSAAASGTPSEGHPSSTRIAMKSSRASHSCHQQQQIHHQASTRHQQHTPNQHQHHHHHQQQHQHYYKTRGKIDPLIHDPNCGTSQHFDTIRSIDLRRDKFRPQQLSNSASTSDKSSAIQSLPQHELNLSRRTQQQLNLSRDEHHQRSPPHHSQHQHRHRHRHRLQAHIWKSNENRSLNRDDNLVENRDDIGIAYDEHRDTGYLCSAGGGDTVLLDSVEDRLVNRGCEGSVHGIGLNCRVHKESDTQLASNNDSNPVDLISTTSGNLDTSLTSTTCKTPPTRREQAFAELRGKGDSSSLDKRPAKFILSRPFRKDDLEALPYTADESMKELIKRLKEGNSDRGAKFIGFVTGWHDTSTMLAALKKSRRRLLNKVDHRPSMTTIPENVQHRYGVFKTDKQTKVFYEQTQFGSSSVVSQAKSCQ